MFINNRYALMRHANDNVSMLEPKSEQECRENARVLAGKLSGEAVQIIHSPLERAVMTARSVAEELKDVGLSVTMEESEYLSCEWGAKEIPGQLIEQATKDDNTFVLFVTHLPNINLTVGKGAENNEILAQDFRI